MKPEETEQALILHPRGRHTASVVWLHGLGADGYDFAPIIPELGLPADHGIRFIFPHAPVRPVTLNGGMAMRAWYDILSLDRNGLQDEAGVRDSERIVQGFLKAEEDAGIASDRIVLAGFSQGGAITLHAGLRYPKKLAGLLPLSTYLPLQHLLATEASAANRSVPMLMCHGSHDPVLPYELGRGSCEVMESLGYTIDWREYSMAHQVCAEQIEDIGRWLRERLP